MINLYVSLMLKAMLRNLRQHRNVNVCLLHCHYSWERITHVFSMVNLDWFIFNKAITCEEPHTLANGGFTGVKDTYFIGNTVQYHCELGFHLVGPESAVCLQLEGTYKAEFTTHPVCEGKKFNNTLMKIEEWTGSCIPPQVKNYSGHDKNSGNFVF